MYALSQMELEKVLGIQLPDENGIQEQQAEAAVQRSLPPIVGLDDATSLEERLKIYEATIAFQLSEFNQHSGTESEQKQTATVRRETEDSGIFGVTSLVTFMPLQCV